ncbi:hypothetical protein [Kluyvera intermedia]
MSKEQQNKALEMIRAVYNDGFAEINGSLQQNMKDAKRLSGRGGR